VVSINLVFVLVLSFGTWEKHPSQNNFFLRGIQLSP
jgi:hypothetical protein